MTGPCRSVQSLSESRPGAAAEPVGEPVVVWRAADRLGVGTEAATPAAEAGLLEFGARVLFRHPPLRSAAYRSGSLHERHEVHHALVEVTDPGVDPDRRAWHRAHASPGPDEAVAEKLERSAGRPQARGGSAAAAAFLERAAMPALSTRHSGCWSRSKLARRTPCGPPGGRNRIPVPISPSSIPRGGATRCS
jgi:hypothetical protein